MPARRPGARGAPADPARLAAFETLRAVSVRDAYANLVLPTLLAERGLAGRDAALATELAYGTLRLRGRLDAVLAACVDRSLDRLDPPVLDLLRLGAYQLLETRVPSHAAVSATVDLTRATIGPRPAGLVNAVLRKVATRDLTGWLAAVAPPADTEPIGHLAVVTSHPTWAVAAVREALGDPAATRHALDADNERPAVHLVARPGLVERDRLLAEAGGAARPGAFSPYAVHLPAGDPHRIAAVRSGAAGVQDEGSQLAALALAAAPLDGPDERWLDLCAGPGGKAALLAGLARERGARLVAVEVAPHRARLVRQALAAYDNALAVQGDGTAPPALPGSLDRVLVDAPCSGLGAFRRRPEARWRRGEADLSALGALQRRLVRRAVALTRPGGVLAYVTCSPHPAETVAVVEELAATHPVTLLDTPAVLSAYAVTDVGPGPWAQLWPHRHGTDAMFTALLRVDRPSA